MKKKIGMLSFHDSLSYGATLQCFALQKVIQQLGYESEFINFQRKKSTDSDTKQSKITIKESVKKWAIDAAVSLQKSISKRNVRKVSQAFQLFKDENLSVGEKEFTSITELCAFPHNYEILVTGSDQVWNPYSKFLKVYGLGFAAEEINTVAYAASIGVSEIPEDKKEYLKQNVKSVKHISCREYEGAEALSRLLDRNIPSVLDPTLLLDKDAWSAYASSENKKEKYVLCFFLGSLKYPRSIAMRIAKENRCKLYIIPGSPRDILTRGKIADGCGPMEFLSLFLNADFICTDSFHGTAFCLNFNKPFYSFCRRGFDEKTSYLSRIRDLLETVHLQDRLIYPDSKVSFKIENVDFSVANKVLVEERKKSMAFLINALSDGKQK